MTYHSKLADCAASYAAHGFSVIPIGQSKKPLIKFADKPPLTVEEIEQIWTKYPSANIALKTDKFFVVDIDRHSDGVDGLNSILELNHAEWFKDTLSERTAHDGYHFFFAKPEGVSISQKIGLLPGVDLKAHPNNYVVVSPSVLNGKPYQWRNHNPIKAAPADLIKLIKSKQTASTSFLKTNYSSLGKTKTVNLFEAIINGLGDVGSRNDALAGFIGGLLFRNVNPQVAAELAVIANNHTADPLPIREVERTVNSMIDKEIRRREANDV